MKAPAVDLGAPKAWLLGFQDDLCQSLEALDELPFREELLGEAGHSTSRVRVLEGGETLERASVLFSHTLGKRLPEAATRRRPELAGRPYEAVSVSVIVHPLNPYAPTSHANFRFFSSVSPGQEAVWWFGGGFDLTPYYAFEEDVRHWHRTAKEACDPFGTELYPRLKKSCDDYFFLAHRQEPRGVGGVFFDDWNEGGFARAFGFWKAVGAAFPRAYLPLLERRRNTPWGERQRNFQLYRRGRYVEFNLIWDRGTLFGLQSGGRVESILGSMPPQVRWAYDWKPEAGSEEERLTRDFLPPRDWA